MKISFVIFFIFIIMSCDEDVNVIYVNKDYKLKSPFFKISKVYPEFSFWNHEFYVELELDNLNDSNNVNFYFNEKKLKVANKEVTDLKIKYFFRTPFNSKSEPIQIRYYEGSDSGYVNTDTFKIVNSEIKIDSIFYLNPYEFEVHGKGMEYYEYLRATFKNTINDGFDEKKHYNNNSSKEEGIIGEKISNNIVRFKNTDLNSFGLNIQARESLSEINQLHSYEYMYKLPKDKFKVELIKYNFEGDYIKLYFKNLYDSYGLKGLTYNNQSILGNRNMYSLQPYNFYYKDNELIEELAVITIQNKNVTNYYHIGIFFKDNTDTTIVSLNEKNNQFKEIVFSTSQVTFDFPEKYKYLDYIEYLKTYSEVKKKLTNSEKDNIFVYTTDDEKDSLILYFLDKTYIHYKYISRKTITSSNKDLSVLTSWEYEGTYLRDGYENFTFVTILDKSIWNVLYRNVKVDYYNNGILDSTDSFNNSGLSFQGQYYLKLKLTQ